jgi:hypothetical protein
MQQRLEPGPRSLATRNVKSTSTYPERCIWDNSSLTTPKRVQLRSGPRKYEVPFIRTGLGITPVAQRSTASSISEGAIRNSESGFVDLNVET